MVTARSKKGHENVEIMVPEVRYGQVDVWLLGQQPIILNRMSEKARHELLLPAGRKTAAAKAASAKHDPIAEFQASPYTLSDDGGDATPPTLLAHLGSALKGAMATAALDMPGASKAQIGRLCWVVEERIPIWGEPQLFMAVTRSADMKRTPDIRTRVIVPKWATRATIQFVTPLLNETSVMNLVVGGGLTSGLGDWRPEKGKGTYGQFRPVNDDNEALQLVLKNDRAVQIDAMNNPRPYDDETAELLAWAVDELKRRGQ